MVSPKPTLLLTRPRSASNRFVALLSEKLRRRVTILQSPLIRIDPMEQVLDLGVAKGLIFTSINGVQSAAALTHDRSLPCFCVGPATTRAAQDAGWMAHCAGQTADELVAHLLSDTPRLPLLHLSGRHRRGQIDDRLSAAGLPCRAVAIYDQQLCPLSDAAIALLKSSQLVIVPLFSPRTAGQFCVNLPKGAQPHVIAISQAVLDAVPEHLRHAPLLAETPDAAAMAKQVENCVNRLCRVEGIWDAQ